MTACTVELRERHAGQAEVVDSAKRFNVLMCGRRFGKTALGVDLACEAALDGLTVAWLAPSYKLLDEAWRELVTTLQSVDGMDKNEQQKRLTLPTGGVIECWSLDGEDPARGRKYHLAIIDEAGLVPRLAHIWNAAIRPTLADERGGAWFLGTPKGVGDFSALWNMGQDLHSEEWKSWRMPTASNPFIDAAEIEAMRLSMPELTFQQEILGLPVDSGEHPIGLEHIAACLSPLSEAEPAVWGVDLARAVDFTVAVGLDAGGHVCRLERWKAPWGVTRSRVASIVGRETIAYIDSTGVGDPIVEDLQRDGVKAVASIFTARSKQQWVEGLIAGIQQHRIHYPDGWLRGELESLTAERTALGTRYTAPEGLHDDGVMALALAWFGYSQVVHPERDAPKNREPRQNESLPYDFVKRAQKERPTAEQEMEKMFGVPSSRTLASRHRIPRR